MHIKDERSVIANANGVGRVDKKGDRVVWPSGEEGESRKKPSADSSYLFQTLRQPSNGVPDW